MLALLLPVASAYTAGMAKMAVSTHATPRACVTRMFEGPEEKTGVDANAFNKLTAVTRSREIGLDRTGSIVVTDGTGSFYQSRTLFNLLNDFGRFKSIIASSDDTVNAKKMLISRQGRYSGLLDVLSFHEGATPFSEAEMWLAISPDEASLAAQIDAAAAAGVSRIFLVVSEALKDPAALDAKLAASKTKYTVMRTGPLVDVDVGGKAALKLGELDMPVCEDVPKEDVFRFVTEALTLDEAHGRQFSLCPTVNEGMVSTLKQMRMVGYERRDEIQFLLSGKVGEKVEEAELSEEETAVQEELVLRSKAEIEAERAEELKMLLERARKRGVETAERQAFEEKEKLAKRQEMAKYYSTPDEPGSAPVDAGSADDEDKGDDKPETPPVA